MVKKAVEAAAAVIRSEFTKLLKELSGRVRQVDDSLNDCVSRGFVATNLEERITALKPPYNISMISLVLAIIVERLRQSVRSLVRLKCGQMTMNSILEGTMSELEACLSIRTITANKLWSNSVVRNYVFKELTLQQLTLMLLTLFFDNNQTLLLPTSVYKKCLQYSFASVAETTGTSSSGNDDV